jgi:predicted TIM-barrel fold metal-dependent hydrolase
MIKKFKIHHLLLALLVASCGMVFAGEECNAKDPTSKDLHIYLLIGDSGMAGTAEIPADANDVIDRCYLFNDKNEWEPARNSLNRYSSVGKEAGLQKLGPGYAFARKMLEKDKNISIGLVVNACGESKMEDWLGKTDRFMKTRQRIKPNREDGTLKGAIWFHGASPSDAPDAYIGGLKSLIGNVRDHFNDASLPFVACEVPGNAALNSQLAKLPQEVHVTATASVEGLTAKDGVLLDSRSQLLLGERFAEQMAQLQKVRAANVPKPPSDLKFIDPHVHAHAVQPNGLGLEAVIKWMDERNVERCIISPLNDKLSRPQNEEDYQTMLANMRKYKGRIDRMCLIEPQEVETVDQAVAILKREIADGAIAFGEHYGVGMMFDDPKNLRLYEACEKVGLPVMFHIDQNKNMVEPGMQRVDNVLKRYPNCKLIAHAYWWRQLQDADRQLQQYPNLYADMSGKVVPQMLNRDRKFAREFLIRNQDKIMWATDEGWWSFGNRGMQMNQHYTFFEELDLPKEVRYKIYRGNAEKLFGFDKIGK